MYRSLEKFVDVDDNWYPNYPTDKIRLHLSLLIFEDKNEGHVKLQAWGYDDFYMEKEVSIREISPQMYTVSIYGSDSFKLDSLNIELHENGLHENALQLINYSDNQFKNYLNIAYEDFIKDYETMSNT